MDIAPGVRLGPYEIVAPLGAGGMGEVYRARDTRLDRTVAIKVLPPHLAAEPHLRERFDREARAISGLQHPHICALFDVGREGDTDFLVLEFLEGDPEGRIFSEILVDVVAAEVIEPWGGGKWHMEIFRSVAPEPEDWNGEM